MFFVMIIVFVCISVCSTSTAVQAQIVFPDDEEQIGSDGGKVNTMSSYYNNKDKLGQDDTDPLQDDVRCSAIIGLNFA